LLEEQNGTVPEQQAPKFNVYGDWPLRLLLNNLYRVPYLDIAFRKEGADSMHDLNCKNQAFFSFASKYYKIISNT
jgi:hypothetical protein